MGMLPLPKRLREIPSIATLIVQALGGPTGTLLCLFLSSKNRGSSTGCEHLHVALSALILHPLRSVFASEHR